MKNEPLIAAIRRTCGTQAELARRMGKSRQGIYKLVRGRVPKISEVNRLARAMGISVREVISYFV